MGGPSIQRFAVDLHVHSAISDGDLHPIEVVRLASRAGVRQLSIADHESVGAYSLGGGAVVEEARSVGVTLLPSIEIDVEALNHEIHLLGLGIDPHSVELNEHCAGIQKLRRARASEELEQANAAFGRPILDPNVVFGEPRETFMRPNLIHPLLRAGIFSRYEEAAAWFSKHVRAATNVPRLSIQNAIALVHRAGGQAVVAHPVYGAIEGWLNIENDLTQWKQFGLDGIETDYPYATCSAHLFDLASETEWIGRVQLVAKDLGLTMTAGSDAHSLSDFKVRWEIE